MLAVFIFYFILIQFRALVILIIDRSEGFEAFQLPNFGKQAFKKYQIAMWSFFSLSKDWAEHTCIVFFFT